MTIPHGQSAADVPDMSFAALARRLRMQVAAEDTGGTRAANDAEYLVGLHIQIPRDLMDRLTAIGGRMGFSPDDGVRHAIVEWLS